MTPSNIRVTAARLYFLPVQTRVPLKFGGETLTEVLCVRVCLTVRDQKGNQTEGWSETPLSVQWVWPGDLPYNERLQALQDFCTQLAQTWPNFDAWGHPLEIGHDFIEHRLPELRAQARLPLLAALVCDSAFDLALHDAYGQLHQVPTYETYDGHWMNRDLAAFLQPAAGSAVNFRGLYPADFLVKQPPRQLRAWHLVGGLDPLDESELIGDEPHDGYPVTLDQWIKRDGLTCLKIKLRGTDAEWDYARLVKTGTLALRGGVEWLSADFNCTVRQPEYVNAILDRLRAEAPRLYSMLLYVEQPFPYDLDANRIDVHSVSARKPLFLDESAHDWRHVALGRELGWNGVALKTCKTQSGALLSLCWARAHGMSLMVQDLTNPMLAQISHLQLGAHAGTIMGVETNAMQFYPEASRPEAAIHPGLYTRRQGQVDLSSLGLTGFGYRVEEIERELPPPATGI